MGAALGAKEVSARQDARLVAVVKRAKTFAARGEPILALRVDGLAYERAGSCSNENLLQALRHVVYLKV